jgi:hypothetical protein
MPSKPDLIARVGEFIVQVVNPQHRRVTGWSGRFGNVLAREFTGIVDGMEGFAKLREPFPSLASLLAGEFPELQTVEAVVETLKALAERDAVTFSFGNVAGEGAPRPKWELRVRDGRIAPVGGETLAALPALAAAAPVDPDDMDMPF